LGIGLSVSVFGTIIGLIAGVVSGFYGGTWKDESIQRITDFMLLLPALPILILVSLVFRIDLWQLVLWLTLFGWMGVAKISRAMALQIREEQYVEAARSIGAIDRWIILRHVAPQILTYAFAVIALSVPSVIFTEAVLSFLGLGDPGLVTWGRILYDAQLNGAAVSGYWWWVLTPGFFITLTALGFGLLGNALDKTLQPKMRLN
jgi:peptide/nickel transport system permease protein